MFNIKDFQVYYQKKSQIKQAKLPAVCVPTNDSKKHPQT
jgi:hypothetical protein